MGEQVLVAAAISGGISTAGTIAAAVINSGTQQRNMRLLAGQRGMAVSAPGVPAASGTAPGVSTTTAAGHSEVASTATPAPALATGPGAPAGAAPLAPLAPIWAAQAGLAPTGARLSRGFALGLVGLVAWLLPIVGLPLALTGIALGFNDIGEDRRYVRTGVYLNVFSIIASTGMLAIAAYLLAVGRLF